MIPWKHSSAEPAKVPELSVVYTDGITSMLPIVAKEGVSAHDWSVERML